MWKSDLLRLVTRGFALNAVIASNYVSASAAEVSANNADASSLSPILFDKAQHGIFGPMSAAFTPGVLSAKEGYTLDLHSEKTEKEMLKMLARWDEWGVDKVMVGGTTGESLSFSIDERYAVMKKWIELIGRTHVRGSWEARALNRVGAPSKVRIYAHVAHEDVLAARDFARNVSTTLDMSKSKCPICKVHGIFAMPPVYFKPETVDALVDMVTIVAAGAPHLPFWYYHYPDKTGVTLDMAAFVAKVHEKQVEAETEAEEKKKG